MTTTKYSIENIFKWWNESFVLIGFNSKKLFNFIKKIGDCGSNISNGSKNRWWSTFKAFWCNWGFWPIIFFGNYESHTQDCDYTRAMNYSEFELSEIKAKYFFLLPNLVFIPYDSKFLQIYTLNAHLGN